jgi:hypothetical protein
MTPERFEEFRHKAVHTLMDLNEGCDQQFRIGKWPRWDYDFDLGTLTFSENGVPKVVAEIEVVGTTSARAKTWMWAWANESLPSCVTSRLAKVRAFGRRESLPNLTQAEIPDNEFLGWEMTAISAEIIGAKGGYRCPSQGGFLYLVYTDIRFAEQEKEVAAGGAKDAKTIKCAAHGLGQETFVCVHLAAQPNQEWFSDLPTSSNPWPDAWCTECEEVFQEQGEWNDKNASRLRVKLLCHHCYEHFRALAPPRQSRDTQG